jgi:hypothetical protein
MRVALFGAGGDIPLCALQSLHGVCDVVAVVRPGPATAVPPHPIPCRR